MGQILHCDWLTDSLTTFWHCKDRLACNGFMQFCERNRYSVITNSSGGICSCIWFSKGPVSSSLCKFMEILLGWYGTWWWLWGCTTGFDVSPLFAPSIVRCIFLIIEGLHEKNLNISIYFFFPPITQWCSISDVLFTGGRGVSDFSVYVLLVRYY